MYELPDLGGQSWQQRLAFGPENAGMSPDQNQPGGIYLYDQQGWSLPDRLSSLHQNMEDFATFLQSTGSSGNGNSAQGVNYCSGLSVTAPVRYVYIGTVHGGSSYLGNSMYPTCNIDQQLGDNNANGQIDTNGDGVYDPDECSVDLLQQFVFKANDVQVDPATATLSLSPPQFHCGGDPGCDVHGKFSSCRSLRLRIRQRLLPPAFTVWSRATRRSGRPAEDRGHQLRARPVRAERLRCA